MLLGNKNAVIYGGGGSIGGTVAREFSREGARVFLVGRTREKLETMGHKIETVARQGDAHSILVDPATGLRHGAADKRISGKAAGY